MFKDYYRILGVDRRADQEEIKKAYRLLAKQHHPDVNEADPGQEDLFKDINEAYSVLSDSSHRRRYDIMSSPYLAGDMASTDGSDDALADFLRAIFQSNQGMSGMGPCRRGFGRRGCRRKF